ncbi:hypothetical protein [Streptomyces minutiscleroticus]|uniref:Uncharacterized protein n=1 Tax=Streptomyces minutiscleroticus TaxID=68238 RepID=A0A918KS71_9ACTN|nr:hypothetical protein [Streptomyces minutiscleroticus]GGX71219.1 hypothetical protein GCM10010358_27110 [Streptomyces minutiscleroticus]
MTQEAAPSAQPKSLLEQMEELMAALDADLTRLDADLRSQPATAPEAEPEPDRTAD